MGDLVHDADDDGADGGPGIVDHLSGGVAFVDNEHGLTDDVIRDVALYHHEKLDGSGYPIGLAGEQISPASRIAAMIDIYDAMTTDRPYRQAMAPEEALQLMANEMAPHQLDSEYLNVFYRLIAPKLVA